LMLYGVDALSSSDAWAVGGMHGQSEGTGVIVHWDGMDWSPFASPDTGYWYHAVDIVATDDAWAVGGNGSILHWDAGSWTAETSPTTERLLGISMVPGTDGNRGWAVGENGILLFWDGVQWGERPSPVGSRLTAIEMVSGTEGWAVGAAGTILRYSPSPLLTINYTAGFPGSYFTLTGEYFIPSSTVTVTVNGNFIGTMPTGANGDIEFILNTELADAGYYNVTVTNNPSASMGFWLDPNAPLREKESSSMELIVPNGIAYSEIVYLPFLNK